MSCALQVAGLYVKKCADILRFLVRTSECIIFPNTLTLSYAVKYKKYRWESLKAKYWRMEADIIYFNRSLFHLPHVFTETNHWRLAWCLACRRECRRIRYSATDGSLFILEIELVWSFLSLFEFPSVYQRLLVLSTSLEAFEMCNFAIYLIYWAGLVEHPSWMDITEGSWPNR